MNEFISRPNKNKNRKLRELIVAEMQLCMMVYPFI